MITETRKTDPICEEPRTLTPEPHRTMLRTEMLEPRSRKSRMLQRSPPRKVDRTDNALAKDTASSTERQEPQRAIERKLMVLPRVCDWITLTFKAEPQAKSPKRLTLEPHRMYCRMDNEDDWCVKSNKEQADPNLVDERMLKLEPNMRKPSTETLLRARTLSPYRLMELPMRAAPRNETLLEIAA